MANIFDKATAWLTAGVGYVAGQVYPYKPLKRAYFNFARGSAAAERTECGNLKQLEAHMPKYHYIDGEPWMLLEPAATNLHSAHSTFVTYYGNTANYDQIADPFGRIRASKFTATTTDQPRGESSISPVANTKYTFSLFFKRINTDYVGLSAYTIQTDHNAVFNIATGTVVSTTGCTAAIEPFIDGWYRCSITYTLGSSPSIHYYKMHVSTASNPYTASIGDAVYFFGGQLETGVLSSYIFTDGAQASRSLDYGGRLDNAETLTIPYGVGAMYLDWIPTELSGGNYCSVGSTDGNHRILLGAEGGTLKWYYVYNGAHYNGSISATVGTRYKILHLFGNGKSRVYVNGSLVVDSTTTTSYPAVDRISFGSVDYTSQPLRGYVKDFAIFNQLLTPAEAVSLTTI